MKLKYVYLSGPYTKGNVNQNVRDVIYMAEFLISYGFVPFVPHLTHLWDMMYPHSWDYWMSYDLLWLKKCDCIIRLEGESVGADKEVEYAIKHNIPVFYSVTEFLLSRSLDEKVYKVRMKHE